MKGRVAFGRWHFNVPAKWSWSFIRSRSFWFRTAGVFVLLLVITPVFGVAILPGNPLYPMKRLGESVLIALTPNINYQHVKAREGARAIYAARRLNEAAAMTERLDKRSAKKQISDADTIEKLLQQFDETFSDLTVTLSQQIDRGEHPSPKIFTDIQKRSIELLVKLVHLRLESPPTDQATVLRSIAIINANLATIADALGQPPISKDDAIELSKMVTVGLISKDDLNGLLSQANSNRRLLELLRERVKRGQLPTGIIYAMNHDLVTKLLPKEAPGMIQTVRFDELRKVALLMKTIEPTPIQKQEIDKYLKSYKVGDLIPTNSLTRYTAPLIYGLHLVETMGIDTTKLNPEHMSPERRIFYDLWSPVLGKASTKPHARGPLLEGMVLAAFAQTATTATQTTPTYDQVMSMASIGMIKSSSLLDRVQLELLKALRGEVAYMALPPGWTATDISAMSDSFAKSVDNLRSAEAVQAKTTQAVTKLATVTAPLQQSLSNDEADRLRTEMKTAVEQLRTKLVQNVYNTILPSSAASPSSTTQSTTNANTTTVVTMEADLAALTEKFNKALADLEAKLASQTASDKAVIKSELDELKKDFAASVKDLKDSQILLEGQVKAQAALIAATETKVKELETGQNALAKNITDARQEATDANKVTATKLDTAISTIKETQAQNIATLQNQLNDQAARADELELSLISLTQAQLEQKAALQAEIELSATDRAALQQAVSNISATQAASAQDLNTVILALDSQLSQSIATVAAAASQTQASLELVDAKTVSLDVALAGIAQANLEAKTNLEAELAETKAIQASLAESLTTLAQAQSQTAGEVATLRTDVGQIKQSITDIGNAQLTAQTKIDSLVSASVDWADAATSINVDVAALQQLQTDLEASFTAKSAQLQAQFESYQQQLNDGLNRLTSHTDEQILRLQQETERLKVLLQQAATTAAITTTSVTASPIVSPSVSVQASVAPVISSPIATPSTSPVTVPGL